MSRVAVEGRSGQGTYHGTPLAEFDVADEEKGGSGGYGGHGTLAIIRVEPAMARRPIILDSLLATAACKRGLDMGVSRAISSRADAKLAPCMARPNLFSGD